MPSELLEYFKMDVQGRFLLEVRIWGVLDKEYPHHVKYAFIFLE